MANFQHSPSRVLVEDVFIKKANSESQLDITPITAEINIESSILDPSTAVTLSILDGNNILVEFGIESGDEIEMNIIWTEKPINIKAKVCKIKDVMNGESSRVINIQCFSYFFFESDCSRWNFCCVIY